MTEAPKPARLAEAVGISRSYASEILSGVRRPSRPLAVHIYRKTGWRHRSLAELSDEQMTVLEGIEPWSPRGAQVAA